MKENYENFSSEISSREELRYSNAGPHKEVIVSRVIHPSVGHFKFVRQLVSKNPADTNQLRCSLNDAICAYDDGPITKILSI